MEILHVISGPSTFRYVPVYETHYGKIGGLKKGFGDQNGLVLGVGFTKHIYKVLLRCFTAMTLRRMILKYLESNHYKE